MQGWKGKEGDGTCYCHKVRWWWQEWWVVLEWLNLPKCLGIILLKVCLESCYVMAKKKKTNPSKFFLRREKTACARASLLGWFWSSSLGTRGSRVIFLKLTNDWALSLTPEICHCHLHRNWRMWKTPEHLADAYFKKMKLCKLRYQEGEPFKGTQRNTKLQSSSSARLIRKLWTHKFWKNHSFSSAPGLSPLCVCYYSWNLSSQNIVLNFLKRTYLK